MKEFLQSFAALPDGLVWFIFLAENALLTVIVLVGGRYIQLKFDRKVATPYAYTRNEWFICTVTNILNTVVTYGGYWLWKAGGIRITYETSWMIVMDFLLLLMAMDLLMYIFHFIIHKTFLYNAIHALHHRAVHPKPIDLFVLHPVETISFGTLWLILLVLYPFNIYAIIVYLTVNLAFGLIGHLGIEPFPTSMRRLPGISYLGTSTFHHSHHEHLHHNFGFYTNIWDRLFGTLNR